MPRANRYILPGCAYHITHRCHDHAFLFRFGVVGAASALFVYMAMQSGVIGLMNSATARNGPLTLAPRPSTLAP